MSIDVSFITTVRNGEKFIADTVNSVLNQSMSGWEYIIVDAGSTDGTLKIIHDYMAHDSRIKIIETKGVGRGRALNLAIKKTFGKYVVNIDVDDPCHYQRAEIQKYILDRYKNFSSIATASTYLAINEDPSWTYYDYANENIDVKNITITKDMPFSNTSINHSSVMFRREALIDVGMYMERRKYQFDYELWIRLSLNSYEIGFIPLKLSSKRIHLEQSFEIRDRKKYLKSALKLNLYIINSLNLSSKYYYYVYLKYLYGYLPKGIRKRIKKVL